MQRLSKQQLSSWMSSANRKPVILRGARQVGKTYLLKEFGQAAFPVVHYVNFEEDPKLARIFEQDLRPGRIVDELRFYLGKPISTTTDLIIFDEIQRCPQALTALKYFNEELPEMALCAAGSLLGVCLAPDSFPVGKVSFIDLYPLNFEEFLKGIGESMLAQTLREVKASTSLPEMAHEKLWELWKHYLVVGGMPEAVNCYAAGRHASLFDAFTGVRQIQRDLIDTYVNDIAKHSGKTNALHIERLWRSIPAQLARMQDGQSPRFRFKDAIEGISGYQRLSGAIDWLESAGLLLKTFIVERPNTPLSSQQQENRFKLYCHDTGLLGALSGLAPEVFVHYGFGSYQGYIAENFVAQELVVDGFHPLHSWQGRTSEVEFLLESGGTITPVEVKSGRVTNAKSLTVYQQKFSPTQAIVLSGKNVWRSASRTGVPVYAAGRLRTISN
jgi:predicted AAA+ superfamily ATPase